MRPPRFISTVCAAAVACAWAGLAHAASGGTDTAGSGQPVCNQDSAYNIACGASSTASGNTATAVGYRASASYQNATAVGPAANAANTNAIAVGAGTSATGIGAITTGAYSSAGGINGSAYGIAAHATGNYSAAVGAGAEGVGFAATAAGAYSKATGNFSASFGVGAESGITPPIGQTGTNTTAVGAYSKAQGDFSTAIGSNAVASEVYSAAIGASATAATNRSMALGPASYVTNGAPQGTAIGVYSNVTTSQSAAIGYGSVTSSGRANVVSVGSGGQVAVDSNGNNNGFLPAPTTRIIENVTDGQYSQDAATVNQLPGQFVDSSGTPSASPTNFYRFGNNATGSSAMTTGSSAVQLRNVAAGTLSPTSTDAVNGSQLYATNQNVSAAQTTANTALSAAGAAQTTANQALQIGQENTLQIQAVNSAVFAVNQLVQANICHIVGSSITCGQQAQVLQGNTLADPQNPANAIAATAGATAIGYQAQAKEVNSTALGTQAQAGGQGAVAVGANANAAYQGAVAIGQGAAITAPTNPNDTNVVGAIAIGMNARANADPATAVGAHANAAGRDSVALGYLATANGVNSVALGSGSEANRDNSVSVGNAATGLTRQITNVAPGTKGTDAVNVNQLEAVASSLRKQINATGAMAAAMSNIQLPPGYSKGLGVAIGSQRGQSALAIGFVATPKPNLLTRISASISGNTTSVGAGIAFGW